MRRIQRAACADIRVQYRRGSGVGRCNALVSPNVLIDLFMDVYLIVHFHVYIVT